MSNQENNKSDSSNFSNTNSSTDKNKSKSISTISNSAAILLREALIPSSGTSTTTTLNSLLQNQKPQSSSTALTTFSQEEWNNNFSQQNNVNANIRNDELGCGSDTDWNQWIPENNIQNIDIIDPYPSAKSTSASHIYPLHHHHPHRTNYSLYEDGSETLNFLNSNNYTEQIYNEDFNQITSNRQKDYNFLGNSKFVLEEFLESKDIHEYLLKTSYTDDIYGIPILLKKLIIEAKNELNNQDTQDDNITLKHRKTAIERLKMVRDHLVEKKRNLITENNNVNEELLLNNWLDKWTGE